VIAATAAHDVVVIGAGVAGLSAATELHRLGVRNVVVLERDSAPGGLPRLCGHPGFGLKEFHRLLQGPEYARRLVAAAAHVDVRTGHALLGIDRDGALRIAGPAGPATLRARAVLLALGTRETPRAARLVGGTRPWGVFTTGSLQQLVHGAHQRPCRRAVIVGSELVALSNLLTLRHAGIIPVAIVEEARHTLAPRALALAAGLAFRTPVLTGARPVAIHGVHRVESLEIDDRGHRRHLACDGVIFTGRFVPDAAPLAGSPVAIDPGTGGPVVDQYGRTSIPTIFAAGNVLRPVEPSWTAWTEGRAVAQAIAAQLDGRLPAPTRRTTLSAAAPLRFVCPQQWSEPSPLRAALPMQARSHEDVAGRLRLTADGVELWSRHARLGPARRTAVGGRLDGVAPDADVVVEVVRPN
jgi:thioredoxin reductase